MMKINILCVVLLASLICSTSYGKQQLTYYVPNSYGDVIAAVERLANEPRRVPFKVPNLPALIEGKDLHITTDFRPSRRHYIVNIVLENDIGKLNQFDLKIEVWGKPKYYVIRSTVDIGWDDFRCRLLNKIKDRIVSQAECAVLCLEKQKVMEYSSRIKTVEVEQPITWSKIASDTFDVITLIILKIDDAKKDKSVVKPKVKSAPKAKINK